ncbi:N-acetylmuramic acid 6-phosphate etherase [Oscillospiraceae bacterium PP1C4]
MELVMLDLTGMTTEKRNRNTMELDKMSPLEIVTIMNGEDSKVAQAVSKMLPQIAQVAQWAAQSLGNGGRLIYMGAGTSGRLGVLDAVECPPTFGVSPGTVVGLIAGGEGAFVKAVEGAEDNEELCVKDLEMIGLNEKDTVVGIAASGRTPYVIGGLQYAKKMNCPTAAISCNKDSSIGKYADIAIEVVVGPEVLSGSTRLKAGTAQKMVLNMISTTAMILIGKVYQNLMVDVMQTNEKLRIRAENIIMEATGADRTTARAALDEASGSVKVAVVMVLLNISAEDAKIRLKKSHGHIRKSIDCL